MKKNYLHKESELLRSGLSMWLPWLKKHAMLKRFYPSVFRGVIKREGGIFTSSSLRRSLEESQKITLGTYSYADLGDLLRFPEKTVIGRYVSIGPGVRIFQANHPTDFLSMHPYFYRSDIGIAEKEAIDRGQVTIGHDAWLGANSIICPGCHRIGVGAVVGAGAVVTKDVPDYAIVAGNPARVIKMRFPEGIVDKILNSKWWELSFDELRPFRKELTSVVDEATLDKLLYRLASLEVKGSG